HRGSGVMCGIAGGWSSLKFDALRAALPRMMRSLAHRGPDSSGQWLDANAGIALGHQRLAIIDPSRAGHQPMQSHDGRYVLILNGEIYNHQDLRRELEAHGKASAWRGHADTETLLEAIAAWGLEGALQRSVGMFALALWDRDKRTLWLARDRLGEKPLSYGWSRGVFLFASELKAMRAVPGFDTTVDRQALAHYVRDCAVAAPFAICRGMRKLRPGHLLRLGPRDLAAEETPPSQAYWSAAEAARAGRADPFPGSEGEAADALEGL